MSNFTKLLGQVNEAYEAALSDKADANYREGVLQDHNDKLRAMLELCIEAMAIKVTLVPPNFTITTAAYQRIKGTREQAIELLGELTAEGSGENST